ncbi:hypothetical protein CCACVL1_06778, partial [Corchorus capsularis]
MGPGQLSSFNMSHFCISEKAIGILHTLLCSFHIWSI